jgi:hypothetical protein
MPILTPKRSKVDWDKVAHLVLRTIPFLAGPEIYDLVKDLRKSRGQLNDKVTRAAVSLHEASQLVADLQGELTQKLDQVQRLKSEYERYQQLATVEEEKAKALIQEMQTVLGAGQTRERWNALGINFVAGIIVFVLGVWLSPRVGGWLGIR